MRKSRHATAVRPEPASLWRNRDYLLLASGQLISVMGTGASTVPFVLLVLALTHSATQAGIVVALTGAPYVVLSLPAGALIDRWDRKRVMMRCGGGSLIAMISVPLAFWTGHLSLAQLYVVSALTGSFFVFYNIAEVAALPRVVTTAQLPAATAQNQAILTGAGLIGPPLGGLLYQLSPPLPFLLDALSYGILAVSLLFIRVEFQQQRTVRTRHLLNEIGEGLGWLWHQPLVRFMAFLTGGMNCVNAAGSLLLIILARRLHAPPSAIGTMLAIASVGGVVGSIVGTRIQQRFTFAQVILGTNWFQTLLFPLYILAPNVFVLGLIAACMFFTAPVYNVVQRSYRLALIPDALQGRVNSVFRLLAFGFLPIGDALAGVLIQTFGIRSTDLIFTAVLLGLALLTTMNGQVRAAASPAAP